MKIPRRIAAFFMDSGDRSVSLTTSSNDFEERASSISRRSALNDHGCFRIIKNLPFGQGCEASSAKLFGSSALSRSQLCKAQAATPNNRSPSPISITASHPAEAIHKPAGKAGTCQAHGDLDDQRGLEGVGAWLSRPSSGIRAEWAKAVVKHKRWITF
jgi:hypothetical protein